MDVLSIFATAFGLLGFAGGAVGYFAKGRGDAVIDYQAKQLELYKDDNSRLEKALTSATTERDSLLRERQTLKELAQGSPQLEKLTRAIDNQTRILSKAFKGK